MQWKEHEPIGSKTTMRIGGTARYFGELKTESDVEEAVAFAKKEHLPFIVLGSGSNTIFADGEINALVVRIGATETVIEGNIVKVQSGKNLAMLINELAAKGLDLSPLTGIPGTIGGAIFGNAGQGPKGTWLDSFIESVTAYVEGEWKTFSKEECNFRYRESFFKDCSNSELGTRNSAVIWSATLNIPSGDPTAIKAEIERLLKKRIETQPHQRTAGSCFKAVGDTPAWQLIDKEGLRGYKSGGVNISEKHANFLISEKGATFEDALNVVNAVKEKIPHHLEVEMRFIGNNGILVI